MFSWKKKSSQEDDISPEIARSLHTMEDDLNGKSAPQNSEFLPPEPPARFVPDPLKGVPFIAPQETIPSESMVQETSGKNPFLGENITNPFLESTVSTDTPSPTAYPPLVATQSSGQEESFSSQEVLSSRDPRDMEAAGETPSGMRFNYKKIWFLVGIFSVLLFVGGGVYYYFFIMQEDRAKNNVAAPTQQNTDVLPLAIPEKILQQPLTTLSATQPNYLSIDTETVTAEGLRAELLRKAGEVKEAKFPGAVEFLVRDQNYNPLAFSRFSYLAKLGFTESLLAQINEEFSLYVFVDNDRPRFGLVLSIKNPASFDIELKNSEKGLAQAITPLLYDTTTAPKTGLVFRSGSYSGLNTRFANIDPALALSIDYAVKDNQWFIGTSMNTLRAILDRELGLSK